MTATGSDAGIDFAAIKARARAKGREVKTIINPFIVNRDSQAETQKYLADILDNRPPPGPFAFGSRLP